MQQAAALRGLSLWGEDPGATSTLGDHTEHSDGRSGPAGWAIGETPVPAVTASDGEVTIDEVAAAAAAAGVLGPYFVAYPEGPEGVYSVMGDQWNDPANPAFRDVSLESVAHVDQYTGEVVATYGYQDYTIVAKAVSRGIALHEGRAFGGLSTAGAAAFCLGVIALCITGPLMWWRRRPRGGGLAAPRGKLPVRATPWLAAALVVLGLLLPLFGISLLLLLLLDALVIRRTPPLRKALNTVDR